MAKIFGFVFLSAAICLSSVSYAQSGSPRVEASVSPDSIGIGDRFTIRVEVDKDMTQVVEFPYFEDGDFGNGLEVQNGKLDTLSVDGRRIRLRMDYTMQAFEEGIHEIGRFPVLYMDKNVVDTLLSENSLMLYVGTFEIDTLAQTIYGINDIKRPMDAPVRFGEFAGYSVAGIIFLVLLCAGVYLGIMSRRQHGRYFWQPRRVDPPHVVAINELRKLHAQKLWQSGKHKVYYTRMTNILRQYIEDRFGINAREMTSDEIIAALRPASIPEKDRAELKSLLKVADLVKFARYVPEADENETCYTGAYYFVEDTKPDEEEKADVESSGIMEGKK